MATKVEKRPIPKNNSHVDEIVAIVLTAAAVLIFLCLVSYNETDASLITAGNSQTRNWIGPVGANIGAILFSAIGWTAYLLPALFALIAWRIFRSQNIFPTLGRVIGYLLFVASLSGLFDLLITGRKGGILGAALSDFLSYLLNPIGAGIIFTALFFASLLLITNLSYFSFFGNLKSTLESFGLGDWFNRFKVWREEQKQKAHERLERRRELRGDKEKPTISLGEAATVTGKEAGKPKEKSKKKSEQDSALGVKIGDIFKRGNDAPIEASGETISPAQQEEIAIEEVPRPTISVSENIKADNLSEELKSFEISEEMAQIPITPIQATGELEKIAPVEDVEEFAPKPVRPVAKEKIPPQNFDNYNLPAAEFLTPAPPHIEQQEEVLLAVAQELSEKTKEFNVTGRVMHICQGPVVTTYEFKPDPGVKYSRITSLSDDLCLALKAESIRIDRIPGKAFVGIEVPNKKRETIQLREVIESKKFKESPSLLSIALGKSIDGLNYVADLAKMPHLLIAGATGAGKSVGVNTLIVSILYKAKPDEVKLIMVDPKQVELGIYADIPHLATPIITDPKRAAVALKWAVAQMERRYKDLAGWGVRNIDGYNSEVKRRKDAGQLDDNGEDYKKLPYIVIIIDELADLMMVAGKEVEESITRLAQMARAVGIHLVLATQRPSVDVITGLIKANFPSRISFRVSSKIDSRTIIDANGAESLLGRGDMLFLPPGTSNLVRVHGAYVDEKEISQIVEFIKAQGKPEYDTTITKTDEELDDDGDLPGKRDPLFADALKTVVMAKKASTSLLQRHLRIGYGRAAAILDAMVREGYIGEMDGSTRARPILQKAYEVLQEAEEGREL